MKYGNFLWGATGVLFAGLVVGCDKYGDSSPEERPEAAFITLEEVAQLLSEVALGPEQMAEVKEGSTASAGNGYDEEYRMRDLFVSPGMGVGDEASTKAQAYSRPLRDLLREAARERFATKSASAGEADAWLDSLAASDVQIYWPGSENWDGSRLPVITYLDQLDRKSLKRILTEPKNAILRQYEKLFELDGKRLVIEPRVLDLIVDTAIKNKLGARGLRSICERIMSDAMYESPSSRSKTFKLTLDYAKARLE